MTGPRVRGVNAAWLPRRYQLNRYGPSHAVPLVPNDVGMIIVGIDEAHTFGIHVGLAVGVGSLILRYRSGGDDDEAMPGVSVPTGASSRLPFIALDVEMRRSRRLLARKPRLCPSIEFRGICNEGLVAQVDFIESSTQDGCGGKPRSRCRPDPSRVGRGAECREGDHGTVAYQASPFWRRLSHALTVRGPLEGSGGRAFLGALVFTNPPDRLVACAPLRAGVAVQSAWLPVPRTPA